MDLPKAETDEPEARVYLLALLDVLGFTAKLRSIGLQPLYELYDLLIKVALEPVLGDGSLWTKTRHYYSDQIFSFGLFHLPLQYAYFSDTILFWVPYDPRLVNPFFERCSKVFCEALRLGLPLRGAISVGEAILHKKTNIYIGTPIVEAVQMEKQQEWVGVSLGTSISSTKPPLPVMPHQVLLWNTPLKEKSQLFSGAALDWPQIWRENYTKSAHQCVANLSTQGHEAKYRNTLDFIDFSDANPEWFTKLPTSPLNS